MEILRIDVSNKKDNFDELYNILEEEKEKGQGNFLIYSGNFIVVTQNADIKKSLENICDINVSEIKDVNKEIDKEFVKSWLKEELSKNEIKIINDEIKERTSAMYDILLETEKILKEKEELDKRNELQKGKSKNKKT